MNLRNSLSHGLIDEADRAMSAILIHAAVHLTILQVSELSEPDGVGGEPNEGGE
jgi:hypothetical protein